MYIPYFVGTSDTDLLEYRLFTDITLLPSILLDSLYTYEIEEAIKLALYYVTFLFEHGL